MTVGDDQGMSRDDWIAIPDDQTMLTFLDDPLCGEGAKRANVHVWIQP